MFPVCDWTAQKASTESVEWKRRENDRTSDISTADDSMKTGRRWVSYLTEVHVFLTISSLWIKAVWGTCGTIWRRWKLQRVKGRAREEKPVEEYHITTSQKAVISFFSLTVTCWNTIKYQICISFHVISNFSAFSHSFSGALWVPYVRACLSAVVC